MIDRTNEIGFSKENPVIINAHDSEQGVTAEYEWIEARFGECDEAWHFVMQKLLRGPAGQWLDMIVIKLADGSVFELFFDISSFFGAFNAMDSESGRSLKAKNSSLPFVMYSKDWG